MLEVFGQSTGQGWLQIAELGAALVLSAVIGLEREFRQKNAGLRTHTLVGFGAALFMVVSKYGFADVLEPGRVVLDPSRVAAQIVSGIGFIGAGLIFVRRESVQGLTTAAGIWLTAAVGAACGAGLPVLGGAATLGYLLIAVAFRQVSRHLARSSWNTSMVTVRYLDRRGVLRELLATTTQVGFVVAQLMTDSAHPDGAGGRPSLPPAAGPAEPRVVQVSLQIRGKGSVTDLATSLLDIEGVVGIDAGALDETSTDI